MSFLLLLLFCYMWPIETAPLLGSIFFFFDWAMKGVEVLGIWEGLYNMGLSALAVFMQGTNCYFFICFNFDLFD